MSTITTSPDFFALANLASTLLLGAAFVLVAQISETLRSRRGVRRRDRQVVLLLLAVRIGNTGLDAFSSDPSTSATSGLLFTSRCISLVSRTLILLFLVQHLSSLSLLRTKWRGVFASSMAALGVVAGGAPTWAARQMIVQGQRNMMLVEFEGLAGTASASLVLVVLSVILYRASAVRVVYMSMALLTLLQIAESLVWTVDAGWIWLLTLPLGNAYFLVLLLVLLPTPSTAAPHPTDTPLDSNDAYITLHLPKTSPSSESASLATPPPAIESSALDTLTSRWSAETDARRKGLKSILKGATPAARRGGHRRGGGAVESPAVVLDVPGLEGAPRVEEKERVRFVDEQEQDQHVARPHLLAPKPSFRSLLRSPSSTVAGTTAPSPGSSFSSTGTVVLPIPPAQAREPLSQLQHPPPSRSQTYPPPAALPLESYQRSQWNRMPPFPFSQQHPRVDPHRALHHVDPTLDLGASSSNPCDSRYPRHHPDHALERLINPYSPGYPVSIPPAQFSSASSAQRKGGAVYTRAPERGVRDPLV